jgi:TolB protein
VKRLASGAVHRATDVGSAIMPDWSVSGVIAFSGIVEQATYGIYTVHPNGSGLVPVTTDEVNQYDPDISPDGSKVTYSAWEPNVQSWEIFSVAITHGTPANLTSFDDGTDTDPAWSPDGTAIVFHSIRTFRDDLCVMDEDGSDQTLIDNAADDDSGPDWQAVPP